MNGCQTCGGFGMHHDPIAHGTEPEEPRPRKVIVLHMVYPDGTHTGDCEGCRGKVAAILREWIHDLFRTELPEAPGEVATRILAALTSEEAAHGDCPEVDECNGMCVMGNEVMPGQPAHQGHNDDPRGGYYDWAAYPHPECERHGDGA